jgi:hypothetical protein
MVCYHVGIDDSYLKAFAGASSLNKKNLILSGSHVLSSSDMVMLFIVDD